MFVSSQDNGFDPPSALSRSESPVAENTDSRPDTLSVQTYSLTSLSTNSPAPFSVVTLPSAFSYGSGPFSTYTKIKGFLPRQHLNGKPSFPSFSIPPLSPWAPLFGSHNSAGFLQASFGVLVACAAVVLAL